MLHVLIINRRKGSDIDERNSNVNTWSKICKAIKWALICKHYGKFCRFGRYATARYCDWCCTTFKYPRKSLLQNVATVAWCIPLGCCAAASSRPHESRRRWCASRRALSPTARWRVMSRLPRSPRYSALCMMSGRCTSWQQSPVPPATCCTALANVTQSTCIETTVQPTTYVNDTSIVKIKISLW